MLTYSEIFELFPVIVTATWFVSFLFSRVSLLNPRFIMALFMGSAFVTFLSGIGMYSGVSEVYVIVYPWVFFTALALFPLFYVYVFEIVNPANITKRLFWHFLPAIILLSFSLSLYGVMMNAGEKQYYIEQFLLSKNPPQEAIHWKYTLMHFIDKTAKISYMLLSVIYYIMTLYLVLKHQQTIEDYFATLKEVSLNWVKTLSLFFILALLSGVSIQWFHRVDILNNEVLSSVSFLFLGVFFAIIGVQSNKQNVNIFPPESLDLVQTEKINLFKEVDKDVPADSYVSESSVPKVLKDILENYFAESRPYLNSDLKIWDVARDLNTNRTYISKVINLEFEQRFSSFVNHYRIEEAKRLMSDPKTSNYSLTVLASMSGFLNYSSFVRSFKMEENKTPNEFRQSISESYQ